MSLMVKNIEPIVEGTIDFINSYDCIEEPVRDAVKILNDSGFNTIMSSANYRNVDTRFEKKKDFYGSYTMGNGYAWILVNYATLSSINKDIINKMNSGEIPIELDKNAQSCLASNCEVNGVQISQKEIVKFYRAIRNPFGQRRKIKPSVLIPRCEEDKYFINNHNVIFHSVGLPNDGMMVALRYPLNEKTTVDDVRSYYAKLLVKLEKNKISGFKKL